MRSESSPPGLLMISTALNAVMFRLARVRSSERHEIATHIDALERLVNNAAERLRSINDFARSQQSSELQSINLEEQIRSAIEMVEFIVVKSPTIFGAKTNLDLKIASDLPPIAGQPAEIAHVFANLLLNARDAMQHGGTISIEAGSDREAIRVLVADQGHGINPGDLGRVFDPFFTTKPNGSGLGLSMART